MKTIFLSVFMLVASLSTFAQNGESIKVQEDPRIAHYLNEFNRIAATQTMPEFIYRVQLISTYERGEANGTRAKFRNLYPNEPSFLRHDGIKFLVEAGEFTTRTDAEVMLRDLRRNFPSAFLLPPKRVQ